MRCKEDVDMLNNVPTQGEKVEAVHVEPPPLEPWNPEMPVVFRSSGREIFNCSSNSKTFNPSALERSKFWLPKSFGYVKPCSPMSQKRTAPKLKPCNPRTLKPWNFETYNPQKVQTPEKFKSWNPGSLKLLKEWLPKSFWNVQPCSTTTPKETAPKLKPYNHRTLKPWNLQPWNPKTLRPSNPQTLKLSNLQQPSKNSNPGKNSKTDKSWNP